LCKGFFWELVAKSAIFGGKAVGNRHI
jgi:hypothetical protein